MWSACDFPTLCTGEKQSLTSLGPDKIDGKARCQWLWLCIAVTVSFQHSAATSAKLINRCDKPPVTLNISPACFPLFVRNRGKENREHRHRYRHTCTHHMHTTYTHLRMFVSVCMWCADDTCKWLTQKERKDFEMGNDSYNMTLYMNHYNHHSPILHSKVCKYQSSQARHSCWQRCTVLPPESLEDHYCYNCCTLLWLCREVTADKKHVGQNLGLGMEVISAP